MKVKLKKKLWTYIVHNNPDLVINLQEKEVLDHYLEEKVDGVLPIIEQLQNEGKPIYIIEELCLNAMTEDLRPSRYNYICNILEEEFPKEYEKLKERGALLYEVCCMIEACKNIFQDFNFSKENEDNRFLKYAIIGQVHDYLT